MGYFRRKPRRVRLPPKAEAVAIAGALPLTGHAGASGRRFLRFAIPDGERIPRDGIFVAAYDAMERRSTERWAREAITSSLEAFARDLPLPHIDDERARFFARDDALALTKRLWELCRVLRSQGIFVEMIVCRHPGTIAYSDAQQIAAIPPRRRPVR